MKSFWPGNRNQWRTRVKGQLATGLPRIWLLKWRLYYGTKARVITIHVSADDLTSRSSVRNTLLAASQNYGPGAASATDVSDSEDDDDSDISETSSVATIRDALPGVTASRFFSPQPGVQIIGF